MSRADQESIAARKVDCPWCGAVAYDECVDGDGARMGAEVHSQRVTMSIELTRAETPSIDREPELASVEREAVIETPTGYHGVVLYPSTMLLAQSPIARWAGSKRQLLPTILPLIPKQFGTYWEPFLGSGAVAFALLGLRRDGLVSFDRAVLSDSNVRLIQTYRALRDSIDHVVQLCYDVQAQHAAGDYYTAMRTWFDDWDTQCSDTLTAAGFLYLNATCFNGMYRTNAKGTFNVPQGTDGKKRPLPFDFDEERLRIAGSLLRDASVRLYHRDFGEDERAPYDGPGDFFAGDVIANDVCLVDPPYAALKETADFGEKAGGYGGAGFTMQAQAELSGVVAQAKDRGAVVIAHNSVHSAIRAWYVSRGFQILDVTRKGTISSKGAGRGRVAEIIALGNVAVVPAAFPPSPPEPKKRKTKMPKKSESASPAQSVDPVAAPSVSIVSVTSNVKSDSWTPWTVQFDSAKVLITGANGRGKSAIINAIELALSGRATDVVMRDPKLPAELLALAPPGAGLLSAVVEFSDGAVCKWSMAVSVVKGERKAARPNLSWESTLGVAGPPVLPIRDLEEAIGGSSDKARAFFLRACESVTTDADVKALLPSVWHADWDAPTSGITGSTKVLWLIESTRAKQREQKEIAKTNALLVQQVGERMHAGRPTPSQMDALRATIATSQERMDQIETLRVWSRVIEARRALVAVQQQLDAMGPPPARPAAQSPVLSALSLVLRTAVEKSVPACPLCETPAVDLSAATARVTAFMDSQREASAAFNADEAARTILQRNIDLCRALAQEGVEIPAAVMSYADVDSPETQAAMIVALTATKKAAEEQLREAQLLDARWDDVSRAKDSIAMAQAEGDRLARFEGALVEVRDALVSNAVSLFGERVNALLPEGDRFGLMLNDSTGREVFQIGLWRGEGPNGAVFHAALSGAEETRVLAAVASVLSAVNQAPAVIIPRERAHDPVTLTTVLKALNEAAGVIVLTTVENPGVRRTKGWCVVDVEAKGQSAVDPNEQLPTSSGSALDEPAVEPLTGLGNLGPLVGPPLQGAFDLPE